MDAPDFPDDLVQTQRAFNAAYAALAMSLPRDTTALRRHLLHLSVRLQWHSHWRTTSSVPAARMRLRQTARARDAARAA